MTADSVSRYSQFPLQMMLEYEIQRTPVSEGDGRNDWNAEELQSFCGNVLRNAFPAFRDAAVDARYYPYMGLTHTLRRKGEGWLLRISDHCRQAPAYVIEAIVMILAGKVMRRKVLPKYQEIYDLFRKDPAIETAVRSRRQRKGRKRFSDKPGEHHSLMDMYRELNARYFNRQIDVNRIGWGLRKSWDRLGHYDPIHHTITLSPTLDSPDVPPFVVRYIVYHEMLHALFGDAPVEGARRHHPREFRRAESAYPDYARAKRFLGKFSRRRER